MCVMVTDTLLTPLVRKSPCGLFCFPTIDDDQLLLCLNMGCRTSKEKRVPHTKDVLPLWINMHPLPNREAEQSRKTSDMDWHPGPEGRTEQKKEKYQMVLDVWGCHFMKLGSS